MNTQSSFVIYTNQLTSAVPRIAQVKPIIAVEPSMMSVLVAQVVYVLVRYHLAVVEVVLWNVQLARIST